MKTTGTMIACVLLVCAFGPRLCQGQNLLSESGTASNLVDSQTTDAPDAKQYAEGRKAIRDGRWADAVKMFDGVAQLGQEHAAGALYWKAYALNKLGQVEKAIETCQLVKDGGKTGWRDDCDALEIEIRASNGLPSPFHAEQSDELKLLALAALMRTNPQAATQQITEIVQGDSSEKLKEGAVFILGQQVPESSYPQIVRISYLEGDVRIARASGKEKAPKWENAVMNMPLSEGDSLVTGKDGRAEIEFEDSSTIYLAENTVLNCIDMHTTAGVPHTELALVSGTMTNHLDSLMGGETFLIRTPVEAVLTRYPQNSNLRLTSYLDGVAVTPLAPGVLNVMGSDKVDVKPGKTMFFSEGHPPATAEAAGKTEDFSAFDAWVADRYAGRQSATAEMMKDAGLAKPIPGLAEMKGKGHFFECPPYGTCWEPDTPQAKAVLTAPPAPPQTPKSAPPSAGATQVAYPTQSMWFPCLSSWYPGAMGYPVNYTGYPVGYLQNPGAFYYGVDPYAWAVCHSGWWVPYNNRYAWVAGLKRHHQCPVKWVRFGNRTVAVPLHPKDVKGKPPVNRGSGFEPVKGKDGLQLRPIRLEGGKPIDLMKSPPKSFRNAPQPVLTRAEAPRMQMLALHDNPKAGISAHTAIPMTFNHQQGFMTSQHVIQGGRAVPVNVPVGRVGGGMPAGTYAGHGGSGGHGGSVGFGAISRGGSFGGSGGRASGGGATSGGSAHGGGSVSGGGSHASAPSASSTAASAPASSAHK